MKTPPPKPVISNKLAGAIASAKVDRLRDVLKEAYCIDAAVMKFVEESFRPTVYP
jgi:hypothetical protein